MTGNETTTTPAVEDVRDFWNRRPCNVRHGTAEIGTREYFDQVEARKYLVEPHIPGFADFDAWKGKRVLEIGCGLGTDALNFARAGADYTGFELSAESLKLARKRFEVFGLPGTFYEGDAERLAEVVPAGKYDLIYSFGVIHHTPHPERVVRAAREYLKPEGELRMMLYAQNSWKGILIEEGFDQPEAQSGCPVAFTYTEDEVRELLDGYEVIDIAQDHIFPYVIEKYVKYEHERQPWFAAMPDDLFRALERRLGWHLLIRAKLAG